MIFRFIKKINLKTKYKHVSECLNNCRDIKYKTYRLFSSSKAICGEVDVDESTFKLSSLENGGNIINFSGKVVEDEEVICMKGEMKPGFIGFILLYGIRFYAIHMLIKGLIEIQSYSLSKADSYNSVFLLMVGFLVIYFTPQFIFYCYYKSLSNNLSSKVNQ